VGDKRLSPDVVPLCHAPRPDWGLDVAGAATTLTTIEALPAAARNASRGAVN
jgi:hypothetical protein